MTSLRYKTYFYNGLNNDFFLSFSKVYFTVNTFQLLVLTKQFYINKAIPQIF